MIGYNDSLVTSGGAAAPVADAVIARLSFLRSDHSYRVQFIVSVSGSGTEVSLSNLAFFTGSATGKGPLPSLMTVSGQVYTTPTLIITPAFGETTLTVKAVDNAANNTVYTVTIIAQRT